MRRTLSAAAVLGLALLLASCPQPSDPDPDPTPLPELETRVETRFERFVERYDDDGPIEQWVYDGSGDLTENLLYTYESFTETTDLDLDGTLDEKRLKSVAVYSSATVHDPATTQTAAISYEYDGTTRNIVRGELREGAGLALSASYDATYNAVSGRYATFLLKDGAGTVIENRVCTYNADGTYAQESYYRDEAATVLKERYTPLYSGSPARTVQETHTVRIPAAGGVGEDYETTMVNVFSYNGDDLYLQSTYAEDDPGTLVSALLYTFADVGPAGAGYREKRTRSVLNADGQLMQYRSYTYDPDGYAVGVSYFDYAAPDGEELRSREAFSYYEDASGNLFYEESRYTYDYPAAASGRASASGRAAGPAGRDRLSIPAPTHLGE